MARLDKWERLNACTASNVATSSFVSNFLPTGTPLARSLLMPRLTQPVLHCTGVRSHGSTYLRAVLAQYIEPFNPSFLGLVFGEKICVVFYNVWSRTLTSHLSMHDRTVVDFLAFRTKKPKCQAWKKAEHGCWRWQNMRLSWTHYTHTQANAPSVVF